MNRNELSIPVEFRKKVYRYFREAGEAWLNKLPDLLDEFIGKWQLTDCRMEENLSVHYICYAKSPEYGEVVLKTGFPHLEFYTGLDSMILYGGKHSCKLYEFDRENSIMLLERIVPGIQLRSELDFAERIRAGTELVRKLPAEVHGSHSFPVYQEQLARAFGKVRELNRAGKEFLSMLYEAENFYEELRALNRPKVLLHGDLHHENILKDAAGSWKVIDPQGRIGEQCLETGRFLLNEWEWFEGKGDAKHMTKCIDAFADALGESRRTIAISCFLDYALSNSWELEDGSGPETVEDTVQQMKCLLEIIK